MLKRRTDKNVRPNPFAGADEIYLTKNKIAVVKTRHVREKRGYTKTQKTKYYVQSESNKRQLKKVTDSVRRGRKGDVYERI